MAEGSDIRIPRRRRDGASPEERLLRLVTSLWHSKLLILFLMAVTAVCFCWHSAKENQKSATATLMLRYEQAYEGLNPNGTRFNIYDLMSDQVLGEVIQRAGLKGRVSQNQLLNMLEVRASGSQSAKNMYIATEYSVILRGEDLPSRISARSLLDLLMETYKQYFLQNYGANDSALDIDWSEVENWEYLEFANIMDVKVNNLITYLNGLRTESGMSQYRISGESFRSLSESIANFRDIYLNKYTSFVTINRLFRNPESFRSKLEYRRFLTQQSISGSRDYFQIYQDALTMYDASMITFVMVPMYDSAQGLYMARTSIGMDSLTERSKGYAENLETSAKTLKTFDRDIDNTFAAANEQAKRDTAESMIREIEQHLDSLISRVRLVERDYEAYRSKNSIYYVIGTPGILSGYNVKGGAAAAIVVFLICVLYCAIQTYAKRE